uniref:Aminopeptidase n=1 Tax=Glossina pallidipes TaxID=7398 RepID=A0A1B0AGQ9_GLOPL
MIIAAKLVSIGLSVVLLAFTISTIVLAVQKSNLLDDLNEAYELIESLENALNNSTASTTNNPTTEITETTTRPEELINYRLPETLYPINYDLYLHPDIDTGNFTGQVLIHINCTENTDQIILHALHLNITNVYLSDTASSTIAVKNFYLDSVREFLIIDLNEELPAGRNFKLGIFFEGSMVNKIIGLYRSSYLKADNTRKWMATSKFEPTYARQAFPCFDEPALKATFTVVLVHPDRDDYHALSNMDVYTEKLQGSYKEVYFNTSVPMSTYLACFIVSDFDHKSVSIETNGIGTDFEMRVFATPEQVDKIQFALEVGKVVIEYYINYFQIEYPLPKLDMAAIPDFVSGAMEHWGLVTYRETALLYDEMVSSTENKQRIASVIAHEFAHMWFGNLVTMMWWNDLWLNEGFAKYIENKGVEAKFPEWGMQDQFVTKTLHEALSLDATLAAHPIIQTVTNPDQITEIFDTITYSKGASIIRMLEDFLGPQNFQRAVTNYLNKFKYRNAVTDDFLTEIDNLNLGIDVKTIMRTWTEQMGLPVVNVEELDTVTWKLTQKRFFANPQDYDGVYDDSPFDYKWSIPITYKTSGNSSVQREWFSYDQSEETDFVPWSVAAGKLTSIRRMLMFTDSSEQFSNYARDLMKSIYLVVGWNADPTDDHLNNRLRVVVLSSACSVGLPDCLTEASKRFEKWIKSPDQLPHPDIRNTVYYYGMMETNSEDYWHQMWQLFVAEKDASEKSNLMYGLAAIQKPLIIRRYVELAWNEEYVRGQDYFTCMQYIASNPVGESIVWDYVREHWPDLVGRFGLNERTLGNMIPSITGHFSTETKLEEMEHFFEKYPEAGAGAAARKRALENVKSNVAWLANNLEAVHDWLQNVNFIYS